MTHLSQRKGPLTGLDLVFSPYQAQNTSHRTKATLSCKRNPTQFSTYAATQTFDKPCQRGAAAGDGAVMASDDREPATKDKKHKRKKIKKDKWGQPLLPEPEDCEEQLILQKNSTGSFARDGEEAYEAHKVVASGMPYSTTEEEIRQMFEECGPIHKLQLSRFPDSGNFRGLAFLTFQSEAAAVAALSLDGTTMGNLFVRIEKCRLDQKRKRKIKYIADPEKAEGCLSVYVGNLSWEVTEDDIRDCFNTSKISSVRFAFDKVTGKSRGFCHVDFEDDESLEQAIKKNQTELQGRPMKIAYALSNRN